MIPRSSFVVTFIFHKTANEIFVDSYESACEI